MLNIQFKYHQHRGWNSKGTIEHSFRVIVKDIPTVEEDKIFSFVDKFIQTNVLKANFNYNIYIDSFKGEEPYTSDLFINYMVNDFTSSILKEHINLDDFTDKLYDAILMDF